MISICGLFLLFILVLLLRSKLKKNRFVNFTLFGIFNLFIIECVIFCYFLYLIYQGNCFFLIGKQKSLDVLIKARLIYSIYYAQGKRNFFYRIDNTLGYTIASNKDTGLYQSNSQGIRANKDYSFIPDENTLRLAVFGDSFVFCDDEKNSDAWPDILENQVGNLEVLNFGVSGYGLGQSYLRYLKDGLKFNPDIIFFNFLSTSTRDRSYDVSLISQINLRTADMYRVHFKLENGILKTNAMTLFDLFVPSFKESFWGLKNIPSWPMKIGRNFNIGVLIEHLAFPKDYSKLSGEEVSVNINIKILENLLNVARKNKSKIIFFYQSAFEGLPQWAQKFLNDNQDQVTYVNSTQSLSEQFDTLEGGHEEILNKSNHYNAKGNALYARAVLKILKGYQWGDGERRFLYNKKKNEFFRN